VLYRKKIQKIYKLYFNLNFYFFAFSADEKRKLTKKKFSPKNPIYIRLQSEEEDEKKGEKREINS
jgi:hypothetical protein